MKRKEFEKKVDKLWKVAKKDLGKVSKDTMSLVKKGETYLKEISKKGEENLESMVLALQREKLYYELGKSVASISKRKWAKNKRVGNSIAKIKSLSRKIRRLKK